MFSPPKSHENWSTLVAIDKIGTSSSDVYHLHTYLDLSWKTLYSPSPLPYTIPFNVTILFWIYLYSMNEHTQLNRLRYIYCNMFTHWNGNMFGLFLFIHTLILWSKLIHIFLDILHGDHNRFSYLKAKSKLRAGQ